MSADEPPAPGLRAAGGEPPGAEAAQEEAGPGIPDLRGTPLERLAALGDSALARAIELYRERVKEAGVPLSSFNARI